MKRTEYYWGTGRRKASLARVRVRSGSGTLKVNERSADEYFPRGVWQTQAFEALRASGLEGKVDVFVNASGGGLTGQSGAVRLGLARALLKMNPELKPTLRKFGLLTRDPRMVERKKFGQKGARGKRQYSKR
ncbi:MAG TPA: 30S ribosomal protein S9 [Synergistales bacterium]|jgi:small subunit ribosomal protein S9|nr:MAG: 30S ribosomal protein S9 [Synergistales bacterium 57_84]KUK86804.1 MAG: 30S ribosomal protein S9 [Synergistales bacterium 58_81]HQO83563.1 30S ribosomal protein S9 [Synergistales bacterium]